MSEDIEANGTEKKGGTSRKPMSEQTEVTGHGSGWHALRCPECGTLLLTESDWEWTKCWNCGFVFRFYH